MAASVARVSALKGLNATLPSSFTQISWRMRVETGARRPAAIKSAAIAFNDPTAYRPARPARCDCLPLLDDAGFHDFGTQINQRTHHPRRINRSADHAAGIDRFQMQARILARCS